MSGLRIDASLVAGPVPFTGTEGVGWEIGGVISPRLYIQGVGRMHEHPRLEAFGRPLRPFPVWRNAAPRGPRTPRDPGRRYTETAPAP